MENGKLWVSDITYMVIYVDGSSGDYKFCYLSLVTDYYTKEIVGWCVGDISVKDCISYDNFQEWLDQQEIKH